MELKNIAESLVIAALKNRELLSELKTLMVEHGMYKEARDLKIMEAKKEIETNVVSKE